MESLTLDVIALRLILAFILSALIGIERERHKQVAGLKTHILICVGSALLMILSIYVPFAYSLGESSDPGRIAAQVVSGIGFLGAGAILRYGFNVRGLTTAANIWVMAALGLAIGAGLYFPAIIGVSIILFTLVGIDFLEKKLFSKKFMKSFEIEYNDNKTSFNEIRFIISKFGKIKGSELYKNSGENFHAKFILQIKENIIEKLVKNLNGKVVNFQIKEFL
jgi:putative Mg2+ transporter-C (MgtC) family protein